LYDEADAVDRHLYLTEPGQVECAGRGGVDEQRPVRLGASAPKREWRPGVAGGLRLGGDDGGGVRAGYEVEGLDVAE
jgi:hypothetical protein